MVVYVDKNKASYVGNGVTRVWPFDFPVLDAAHMQVWVRRSGGDAVMLSGGYAVNLGARNVVYPADLDAAPLAVGDTVTLLRWVPDLQLMDLQNQGHFHADVIEQNFDRLVMMIQQVSEKLRRAVVAGVDESSEASYAALMEALATARAVRDEVIAEVEGFDEHAASTKAAVIAAVNACTDVAEAWAVQSCACAEASKRWHTSFSRTIQPYLGFWRPVGILDGHTSTEILTVSEMYDGGAPSTFAVIETVSDGGDAYPTSWVELNPDVMAAFNPKGISSVSAVNPETGCITITVS